MSFTPARYTLDTPPGSTRQPQSQAALERRRRRRHYARRRRDLLLDTVAALLLTLFTITFTAGLGVVALIETAFALVVIGSYLLDRRLRRSRGRAGRIRKAGRCGARRKRVSTARRRPTAS
jgi:hypothetical protein